MVVLHVPIDPLNTRRGLEPVPKCVPGTYNLPTVWSMNGHCSTNACYGVKSFVQLLNHFLITGPFIRPTGYWLV